MRSWLILCLLLVAFTRPAQAHPDLQDSISVRIEQRCVRLKVNVSLEEICITQGVPPHLKAGIPGGPVRFQPSEPLNLAAEKHGQYLLQHLTISTENQLAGKLVHVTPPKSMSEPVFYQYDLEYPQVGAAPEKLVLFQDMLKEWPSAAGLTRDVIYIVRLQERDPEKAPTCWLLSSSKPLTIPIGWATEPEPKRVAAQSPPLSPPAARASAGRNYATPSSYPKSDFSGGAATPPSSTAIAPWTMFRDFLRHGIKHILTGYDHLLFVTALVLSTLSFWEMVQVVAAFTLAHTLTLTLCVFGIFRLPAVVVEPIIALSIVFVAIENVFWQHRAHSQVRLLVAFGFGLIHGLGFAGGLLDAMAGLPSAGIWSALAAFSLGVEIGHQMVVLPLFGVLKLCIRLMPPHWHPPTVRYACLGIAGCGSYYLAAALHEQGLLWR